MKHKIMVHSLSGKSSSTLRLQWHCEKRKKNDFETTMLNNKYVIISIKKGFVYEIPLYLKHFELYLYRLKINQDLTFIS